MTSLQQTIVHLRSTQPELSNAEIAERLGCHPAYVRAAMHRAAKPPRPKIGPAEQAERNRDMRDLQMLVDLDAGHSIRSTARSFDVAYSYLRQLAEDAKAAA